MAADPVTLYEPLSLHWTWAWPTVWTHTYALHVLTLTPLLVACGIASVIDWRTRKIPNWLTFSMVGAGLTRSFVTWSLGLGFTPLDALAGFGLGFAIGLPLFLLRARGAGDCKLYMAAGVWTGWEGIVLLTVIEAVLGFVAVVAAALAKGKLVELVKNANLLVFTLLQIRAVGAEQAVANGRRFTIYGEADPSTPPTRFTSIARPLPHAVPFLAAAVLAVLMGRL